MVRRAVSHKTGIGIVLLQQGSEVHTMTDEQFEFARIGTLSSIRHCEAQTDSRLRIVVEGGAKFRIHSTWVEDDHLIMALVDIMRDEPKVELREKDLDLMELFDRMNEFRVSEGQSKMTLEDNSASALSHRLSEVLPMSMEIRQSLLEMDHPYRRLDRIYKWVQTEVKNV